MSRYFHISNGKAYGPSNDGESLADYRKRVKGAYGSLRGIEFGKKEELHPAYFW